MRGSVWGYNSESPNSYSAQHRYHLTPWTTDNRLHVEGITAALLMDVLHHAADFPVLDGLVLYQA